MIKKGSYQYHCNGINVAEESWCVETVSDGTRTIESTRDASAFGAYFSVNAIITPKGTADYELTFRTQTGTPILKTMRYRVEAGVVFRKSDGGKHRAVEAPEGALFFPLMRVFTGQMIAAMIGKSEPTTWIVPNIATPKALATLFEPDFSQRLVTQDANETNVFWLSGGPYVSPARLTLRADGMLENYAFVPEGSDASWACRYVSPDP